MGYYLRQLTRDDKDVSLEKIDQALRNAAPDAELLNVTGVPWTSFVIARAGIELALVTREIDDGPECLVRGEIGEFVEELDDVLPKNAAQWLQNWLTSVKCIYAFQIFGAVESDEDWHAVRSIRDVIFDHVGGILQADGEGFSNEDGYHIVWQFSDKVTGTWNMAVLNEVNGWDTFAMDLGNQAHREAFWRGQIPEGVR